MELTINNGSTAMNYRLNEIKRMLKFMDSETTKMYKLIGRHKRIHNISQWVSLSRGAITSTIGGITISKVIDNVSSETILPLSIINLTTSSLCTAINIIAKYAHKKIEKSTKQYVLAVDTLESMNITMSQALSDNSITDSEYNEISRLYQTYVKKKKNLPSITMDEHKHNHNNNNKHGRHSPDLPPPPERLLV